MEKGEQGTAELVEKRSETAGGPAEEEQAEGEEGVGDEMPLVRKRRRLVKAGQAEPTQEGLAVEVIGPDRGGLDQMLAGPNRREGTAVQQDEGQGALPLVLVPEEEQRARNKQAANAKRTEARAMVQDVLYAAPGRLGQVELTMGEGSGAGVAQSEEAASDGSQPYVPDWPHVKKGGTLSSTEVKLEWLQTVCHATYWRGTRRWKQVQLLAWMCSRPCWE